MKIPVMLHETFGIARKLEPVRVGVPIPKGALKGALSGGIDGRPVHAEMLAAWSDGSAKWALLRFLASSEAYGSSCVQVELQSDSRTAAAPARQENSEVVAGKFKI